MSTTTPPPTQTSQGGDKTNWDSAQTKIFLNLCVEQVKAGRRPGSHFNKEGWQKIVAGFAEQTGKRYDQSQLKNKWDNLKKEFKLWQKLKLHDTETGCDSVRNTILADNDWWERRIKEDKKVAKFRLQGPENLEQLKQLFYGLCATGEHAYIPGSTSRRTDQASPEQRRRSSTGENVDFDSIDTGHSTDPEFDIDVEAEAKISSSPLSASLRRRRSVIPASHGKKKRRAADVGADLSDSLKKLVSVVHSKTKSISKPASDNKSEIVDCLRMLEGIPEVACGGPLLDFALLIFKDKGNRDYFTSLSFRTDWQLNWLMVEFKKQGGGSASSMP